MEKYVLQCYMKKEDGHYHILVLHPAACAPHISGYDTTKRGAWRDLLKTARLYFENHDRPALVTRILDGRTLEEQVNRLIPHEGKVKLYKMKYLRAETAALHFPLFIQVYAQK